MIFLTNFFLPNRGYKIKIFTYVKQESDMFHNK